MEIAVLDDYQEGAAELADWASLPAGTDLRFFSTPAIDEDALVLRLRAFDVVVAMRERTRFPASVISRLPKLRLLVSTGMRNAVIDVDACRARGIVVSGARGARNSLAATAETAWALILALEKRLIASHEALRAGRWQPHLALGVDGKVLGLVGLGNIGQRMARMGQTFGMQVIAWSPNLSVERAREMGVQRVDKAELFARSDVVSLHLVLSPSTIGIVGQTELAAMKPDAFLVNTARAGLVDEAALVEALRKRQIGGAGLDVFWREPLQANHPLCELDNAVLTPHLGYATRENLAAFYATVLDNIKIWLDGREPPPLEG
jgi:phosphoglycerate dehydrogenase-like enzyme